MLSPHEVRVEGFDDRDAAVQAIDDCSEADWLKKALLGVVLLEQPFAIRYDVQADAHAVADRIRLLGFRCKVGPGPDPSERVGGLNTP
jgi:hypothetical protein